MVTVHELSAGDTTVCNSVCTSSSCSRQHQKLLTKLFLTDGQFHIKMA